jgi:hypothetical protein
MELEDSDDTQIVWRQVLAQVNRRTIVDLVVDQVAPDCSKTVHLLQACRAFRKEDGLNEELAKLDKRFLWVASKNGDYELAAQYLVVSQDPSTWRMALGGFADGDIDETKDQLLMHIINSSLPKCTNDKELQVAMKALMTAKLDDYLITVLEKILITDEHKGRFGRSVKLQELLIVAAIQNDKQSWRVMGYIASLESIDHLKVGRMCKSNKLYEEAFCLFKKAKDLPAAMDVLQNDLKNAYRAGAFAEEHRGDPHLAAFLG